MKHEKRRQAVSLSPFLFRMNVSLKSSRLLHIFLNTQDKHLIVDTTANNIKQFICNGLLTTLVVLQVERT